MNNFSIKLENIQLSVFGNSPSISITNNKSLTMSRTILLAAFFSGIFIGALSIIVIVVAKTYNFGQKPHENISRPYNYGCDYGKNGKYCDMCGITSQDVNVRVVGGIPAWPHSFPAQVRPRKTQKVNH